ncbi:Ubiquitin carboxyl-terminal hydrolase 21 [Morus notabilis]|uniref:Ubiquitin carboxyl-terminal hydrolase n=1 Tax=Morus notabilis TaxID=981085 RepID=W9RYX1_9ROSA|nr:Ubiquitin carboxyl-terminal hydrolase 21 [Morus notabilis]
MESDPKESQETTSYSVPLQPNLGESPSETPVPDESLDPWRSFPQPEAEAVPDSVSPPDCEARSSLDSDLKAIADQASKAASKALADQSSVVQLSSLVDKLCSGGYEKAQKDEEESRTSLSGSVRSGSSDYDADSGRSFWSSSKDSMFFSDNLFNIQESQPSMVGAGLMNLGNTCFMNAVLQCFTHTVPLVQGLRSCNHSVPCERGFEEFCVVCALHDHIQLSLSSSGGLISPLKYEQEDAHEFLQCFLDRLESCLLDSKTNEKCSTPPAENLVEQVFGGRLISKLQCCNCGQVPTTFEPLIDLSLEIESVDSVPSALGSFTKMEKIEDSEIKFTCENCKEEVAVEKQLMVDQAPSVAVFHLKRFKADGSFVEKIDKHVDFSLELDLQSYSTSTSGDNAGLMYDLYGIIVHVGFSSASGHYFSFIRSSPDTWYRLDDSRVTRVREEYVLSQNAYILFYVKRGTPWFSSLMEAEKQPLDLETRTTSPQSVLDNVEKACPFSTDTSASVSSGEGNCFEKISSINVDACTTTSLGENSCQQDVDDTSADDIFHPLTPPRARSPDVFSFETPGPSYQIPRNHLKSEDQPTCKRLLNKRPDDSETKEAVRYLTRSMPSSRGSRLLDAMFRPQSEGAARKKRKFEFPCKGAGPASGRHKSNNGSAAHPVVAALR